MRFVITKVVSDKESTTHDACSYRLNDFKILHRKGKSLDLKKIGHFVTFWQRNSQGETQPYQSKDDFDFLVIGIEISDSLGQFVFPKSVLEKKGIISDSNKNGKRGFRVYTPYDIPKSKQALNTQKWQSAYFYSVTNPREVNLVLILYSAK